MANTIKQNMGMAMINIINKIAITPMNVVT